MLVSVNQIEEPSKLADTIASHLSIKLEEKQELLEIASVGRPARARDLADGGRDRRAAGGEAHPLARQAADGEDAARILPERADEGDPEGARRRRGRTRRGGRVRGAHQGHQAQQGGPREVAGRGQEAALHEPDVGRGHGGAQLPRLDAVDPVEEAHADQEGHQERREDPQRRPLRAGEGQGADPRVPRGAAAGAQDEGADPLPGGSARRGQDLPRQVGGARDGAQLRALLAGRPCATRPRFAATAAPTSARCRARSSSR